tara:strand:- start:374 stop:640 length:267 start_codon:yes stop_codon:yes gene_type:complete
MTTNGLILDAGSTPAVSTIQGKEMSIFDWFKKKNEISTEPTFDFEDSLEIALWDIKEKYDLETEEVVKTVFEKRNNINYMNECTKSKK